MASLGHNEFNSNLLQVEAIIGGNYFNLQIPTQLIFVTITMKEVQH